MSHMFFSYAHNDYERLRPVFQRMEFVTERMIWIDRIGLQRDAEWLAMLERAIKSSYAVIFAITKEFVTRPFILDYEIPWTLERFNDSRQGQFIFPILFDDVALPELLDGPAVQSYKYVLDARDGNFERMITELKQVIPTPDGEDAPFMVSWPRLHNFKGRDQQLVQLHSAMQSADGKAGVKTAGMYGTGGIGKTQLAVEFAYRYRFYFPGGIFWVTATQDWQRQIADISERMGLKPMDPTDSNRNKQLVLSFERYRKENGQEALLVLDNVADPSELASREISPKLTLQELCRQTNTRLILTTRVHTLPENFAKIEVTKLSPEDSLAVLLDAWEGGQMPSPRVDHPDEMILHVIAQLFDYLPLPLGWIGAALRQLPETSPAELLSDLRSKGVDKAIASLKVRDIALGTPEYYEGLVFPALEWQIQQASKRSPHLVALLQLIAAYGQGASVPRPRLRLLSGLEDKGLQRPLTVAIAAMTDYSLVSLQDMDFRMHALTQEYIAQIYQVVEALADATPAILAAYHDPEKLVRETLARGFEALLTDLRDTQVAIPADAPVINSLTELTRYFQWEAPHLRDQYPIINTSQDGGQYLIQHMRERAHHQGTNQSLQDACDRWLADKQVAHWTSHDHWRHPLNAALIRSFEGHTDHVTAVAFAPDGQTALSGSHDGTLCLWNIATGTEVRRFIGHSDKVSAVAFAPDGKTVLSGVFNGTLYSWDTETGRELHRFSGHTEKISGIIFAPDGRTALSSAFDHSLRLWDLASGRELRHFIGHTDKVTGVSFAPDARIALSGSFDNTLRLWDVATGHEIRRFESNYVSAVTLAPDGRTALSGGTFLGALSLWDVASGAEIRRFEGHRTLISSIAFTPNGKFFISASWDRTLRLWDVNTGEQLGIFEHNEGVDAVAVTSNGRTALTGSFDHKMNLWDLSSHGTTPREEAYINTSLALAVAPKGNNILLGTSASLPPKLQLFDVTNGSELFRFGQSGFKHDGHAQLGFGEISAVAFAPNGNTALSGTGDKVLRLWDVETGTELRHFDHKEYISAVKYSPSGRTALCATKNTLHVWNLITRAEIKRFETHYDRIRCLAFAPDGRTALIGLADNTFRQWNIETGAELQRFVGHTQAVMALAFAQDGSTVLSGSADHTIRLWELTSGTELRRFVGHTNNVLMVAFIPEQETLISCSRDNTIRLWNIETGTHIAVLHLNATILAADLTDTNPTSIVVGDNFGGLWVLNLHIL